MEQGLIQGVISGVVLCVLFIVLRGQGRGQVCSRCAIQGVMQQVFYIQAIQVGAYRCVLYVAHVICGLSQQVCYICSIVDIQIVCYIVGVLHVSMLLYVVGVLHVAHVIRGIGQANLSKVCLMLFDQVCLSQVYLGSVCDTCSQCDTLGLPYLGVPQQIVCYMYRGCYLGLPQLGEAQLGQPKQPV